MSFIFSELQQQNLLSRGFSRRSFGRVAALLAAGSVLPLSGESVLARTFCASRRRSGRCGENRRQRKSNGAVSRGD